MRLLNDLLNMHDGFDDEAWQKECKKRMIDTFPREDPFSILVPEGFDLDKVYCNLLNPGLQSSSAFYFSTASKFFPWVSVLTCYGLPRVIFISFSKTVGKQFILFSSLTA